MNNDGFSREQSIQIHPQKRSRIDCSLSAWKKKFHFLAPAEDFVTTLTGGTSSFIGWGIGVIPSLIIAAIAAPVVGFTTKAMYADTAKMPDGADVLTGRDDSDLEAIGHSGLTVDEIIPDILEAPEDDEKSIRPLRDLCKYLHIKISPYIPHLKDTGTYTVACIRGAMYSYGIKLALTRILGDGTTTLVVAVFLGYLDGMSELFSTLGKWPAQRQALYGEPGFYKTVGRYLIPLPGLPWLFRQCGLNVDYINPLPAFAKFYPTFRAGVHILALVDALQKMFGLSTFVSIGIAWFTPIGASEFIYVSTYAGKLFNHIIKKAGIDRPGLFTKMFLSNPIAEIVWNTVNGRYNGILWGIIIPPVFLYKSAKITGSGLMGVAAAYELTDQLPVIAKAIADQLFAKEIDWETPDSLFYAMLAIFPLVLLAVGYTQVKATEDKRLSGEVIDFSKTILEEYNIKQPRWNLLEQYESYCSGVKQRAASVKVMIKVKLSDAFCCCFGPARRDDRDVRIDARLISAASFS
jgi:hypothetical protein